MSVGKTLLGMLIAIIVASIIINRDNTKKERKQLYRNIYLLSKPEYLEQFKDSFLKNFNNSECYLQTTIMKKIINETRGFFNLINYKRKEIENNKSNVTLVNETNIYTEIQTLFAKHMPCYYI